MTLLSADGEIAPSRQFYENFDQVEDAEVVRLLNEVWKSPQAKREKL